MAQPKQLPYPNISMLLLSCLASLLLLFRPLLRILHNLAWALNSPPVFYADMGISCDEQAPGEEVNCVFCLLQVWEGELLRCGHVFHRACLDEWLEHCRKATCPLCRCSLKYLETKEKYEETGYDEDEYEDEDEDEDSAPPLLALFVRSEWCWRRFLFVEESFAAVI